jgi:hypothetical protein
MADDDAARSTLRARGGPPPGTPPALVVMFYDGAGVRAVPIAPGESFTVGRAPTKADVVLTDRSVSTLHARFERDGELLYVTDLGSRNGVVLRRLHRQIQSRTLVGTGVELWLGDVCAVAYRREDPPADGAGADGSASAVARETTSALTPLGHEYFLRELEAEVDRAALFERRFALLLVAAVDRAGGHMAQRLEVQAAPPERAPTVDGSVHLCIHCGVCSSGTQRRLVRIGGNTAWTSPTRFRSSSMSRLGPSSTRPKETTRSGSPLLVSTVLAVCLWSSGAGAAVPFASSRRAGQRVASVLCTRRNHEAAV